jgi:hydrogenase maturation protein HypF
MKKILALGADMKSRFLIARGDSLSYGSDRGDLSDAQNFERLKKQIKRSLKYFSPHTIAHDLHPGYFSTRLAKELGERCNASVLPVQHHHAHSASVQAEHGLRRAVIGVSFDGTGFGTDGCVWGGEFLLVRGSGFERLAHLKYHKMPGADMAVREPWRMVLSILGERGLPFIKSVTASDKRAILAMMSKGINAPLTSSAGRLFDAAAALAGLCERASFEAEGPVKLEGLCEGCPETGEYAFTVAKESGAYVVDTTPLFYGIARDMRSRRRVQRIASKFHNSMASIIAAVTKQISKSTAIKDVALSGGVFQNRILKEKTVKRLKAARLKVFLNEAVPANDLNIALGQYWVTSHVSGSSGKN